LVQAHDLNVTSHGCQDIHLRRITLALERRDLHEAIRPRLALHLLR
jgi:hypothetical protein